MSSKTSGGVGKRLMLSITRMAPAPPVRAMHIIESEKLFLSSRGQKIFMCLCRNPCARTGEISASLGYSKSAVVQHLSGLIRAGFVKKNVAGNKNIFSPIGMVADDDIKIIAGLADKKSREFFLAAIWKPGISFLELASGRGLPPTTAKRKVQMLAGLGLLVMIRDGRFARIYPSESLEELQKKYRQRRHIFINALVSRLGDAGLKPEIETTIGEKTVIKLRIRKRSIILAINTNPMANII